MSRFEALLKGGDLRSIGRADEMVAQVKDQQSFDLLFEELHNSDRKVRMRAADALEKISLHKPEYLQAHKASLLELCKQDLAKELKWHLALMAGRLDLSQMELTVLWHKLCLWLRTPTESRIVRVNALQSLFDLAQNNPGLTKDFKSILEETEKENIPALKARIRKLRQAGL